MSSRTEELETLIQNSSPQYLAQKFFELETMVNTLQAQVDALMLEYCPDEMTDDQVRNWGKHQVPEAALDRINLLCSQANYENNELAFSINMVQAAIKGGD